jgi:hypothetical protein
MARGMADNDEESVRGSEGDGDHFYLNENENDMGGGNGDFVTGGMLLETLWMKTVVVDR